MSLDDETVFAQTHDAIIEERNAKLSQLNKDIAQNKKARWSDYEVNENLKVKLPAQAVIEGDALVQDVRDNMYLFKQGYDIPERDHGDLISNHYIFDAINTAINGGNRDWKGIKNWVTLRRGMALCEEQMDGNIRPGYDDILESFSQIEKGISTLAETNPLPGMGKN